MARVIARAALVAGVAALAVSSTAAARTVASAAQSASCTNNTLVQTNKGPVCGVMPVYAYEGDNADMRLTSSANAAEPQGSYHDWEPGFLFPGNLSMGIITNLDADQAVLASQLRDQFTAFARTGNPTTTGSPAWPSDTRAAEPGSALGSAAGTTRPGRDLVLRTVGSVPPRDIAVDA